MHNADQTSRSKRLARGRALALIAAIFIVACGAQAIAEPAPPEHALPAAVQQALARLQARASNPLEVADAQTRGGVGVFRVGDDPACDFTAAGGTSNGLQFAIDQAINDGEPVTQIRIANTGSYVNRRYFINDIGDQSLELIGGYATCASTTPSGRTTIDRGTATAGPVFLIDAVPATETVTLENLLIRNGNHTAGGGLEIRNNNFVLTRNLVVRDNLASNGGGISLLDSNDGTLTQLWMLDDNQVLANQASVNGGGIECNGVGARLVLDSGVWINANQATFLGGGIHARGGCEVSSFASPPRGIVGNIAADGGGVSVVSGSLLWLRGDTIPFFGLGDPAQPPIVQSNLASNNGGGIFVSGPGSRALLTDAWVGLNRADFDGDGNGDGGGIFLAGEGELEMDRTLDEADCHRPLQCSRLYSNQAVEGGAVHLSGANARAEIRQTWIDGNRATAFGSVLYAAILGSQLPAGRIPLVLEGNVFTGNVLPGNGELLELRIGVDASIVHNTFADNADSQFDATASIGTNSEIDFFGNLIREGFGSTFSGAWNAPSNPVRGRSDCTIGLGIGGLPPGSTGVANVDPLLDADLRPAGLSPAVDVCSGATVAPTDPDLANVPRGFDVVGVSNGPGTLDAGAFEFVGTVELPGGDVAIFPILVEVDEGVGDVVFLVERTGSSTGAIEVQAQTVNGTATGGTDFTPIGVGLSWADGELGERWFTVPILDDGVAEPTEQFRVVLSILSGSPTITSGVATVRLFDNEQGIFADGFEGPGSP